MSKWSKVILVAIFVGALVLQIFAAKSDSQTTDEAIHLVAGYTYLTKGDFRLDPEHPPLIKEIAAFPLLFSKINTNFGATWDKAGNFFYDSWKETRNLGDSFFYDWGNDADQLLFLGRLSVIFLTLILGFVAFFWAKKLYGEKAGVLAAFLVLFFPNILAHGHLINTDIGISLFAFISIYFWGEFLKSASWRKSWQESWQNLLLAGLFSGLMLASKYTAVIFVLVMIVLGLIKIFHEKKNTGKIIGGFFGSMVIAFIVLWATYGFKFLVPPISIGSFTAEINRWSGFNMLPESFNQIYNFLRPLMVPSFYYKGFVMVSRHAAGGHESFLLGMHSNTGWWYYFPVAILFKTPIAIFFGLYYSIKNFKKLKTKNPPAGEAGIFDEYLLVIPILVYLFVSINSKADLGIRHILPIFPFLFVYISRTVNLVDFKKFWPTLIFSILVLWYFLAAIFAFPNYMAYFNELSAGEKNGHKILTDSNLDWGQDLYRIRDYVTKNNIKVDYITYPWDGQPALNYYGLNQPELKPDYTWAKGNIIISATYYETEAYSWLKKYPMKQITPGVFLVDIN